MKILVKTVICFSLISTIYGKKFGYNNSLTCNCNYEASCQDSGMCTYGGCKQGWSGPTCQKENIAYNKPSNQSSYYFTTVPSSLAVDGYIDTDNYSTCTDMNGSKQGWWLVDLQQTYPITDINIYHSESTYLYRLEGFSVYITGEDLVSTLCYHHTNESLTAEYKIQCNSTGRYVNITSAIVPDDRVGDDSLPDGVLNLCEVEIYVCSVGTYDPDCSSYCQCSQYTRCDDITGYCKIGCLVGWHGNSCNQKCSVEYYGANCQQLCSDRKCKSSDLTCDHVNGTCIDGCKNGWTSHDCSQECSVGYYGTNCQQQCSDRKCKSSDLTCDHVNGTCIDGCKNGWTSHDCSKECSVGYYGANCQQLCSDRKCISSDLTCDHVNGTCIDGCKNGWTSHDCSKECEVGKCEKGCREGYDGIDCMAIAGRTTSSYQQLGTTKDTYITIVVLSSVCSLLVGIGLAIAGVFLYRRCHKNNATGNEIPRNSVISPVIIHEAIGPRCVYEDLSSPEADRQNVYQDLSLDKEDVNVNDTLTDPSYYNTNDKTNMKYANTEIRVNAGASIVATSKSAASNHDYEDLSSPEADRQHVYQDLSLDKEGGNTNETLTDPSYYNTNDKNNMKYVNTDILARTGANTGGTSKSEASELY